MHVTDLLVARHSKFRVIVIRKLCLGAALILLTDKTHLRSSETVDDGCSSFLFID